MRTTRSLTWCRNSVRCSVTGARPITVARPASETSRRYRVSWYPSSSTNLGWNATASRKPPISWVPVRATRSSWRMSLQLRSLRSLGVSSRPSDGSASPCHDGDRGDAAGATAVAAGATGAESAATGSSTGAGSATTGPRTGAGAGATGSRSGTASASMGAGSSAGPPAGRSASGDGGGPAWRAFMLDRRLPGRGGFKPLRSRASRPPRRARDYALELGTPEIESATPPTNTPMTSTMPTIGIQNARRRSTSMTTRRDQDEQRPPRAVRPSRGASPWRSGRSRT